MKVLNSSQQDLYKLPAYSENGYLQAVIEIPAGTNVKYEYLREKGDFSARQEEEKPRVVEFLPYPSNYGFIPSTLMRKEEGGDGDPLDIIVLSESMQQGEVVEVVPLALLKLIDAGEQDYKVLSIPVEESRQIVSASRKQDVPEPVLQILEIWFLNYKGRDKMQSMGWADEQEAAREVKKWMKERS